MQLMIGTTPVCDLDSKVAEHLLALLRGATVVLAEPPRIELRGGNLVERCAPDGGTMYGVLDERFEITLRLLVINNDIRTIA